LSEGETVIEITQRRTLSVCRQAPLGVCAICFTISLYRLI